MTDFWGRIPLEFAGGRLDNLNFALHIAAEARRAGGKAQVLLGPVVDLGTLGILTQHADFREISTPPNWAADSHPEFRAALLDLLPVRPLSPEILDLFFHDSEGGGETDVRFLWTQLLHPLGVQVLPLGSEPPTEGAATELDWSGMWTWIPDWTSREEASQDPAGRRTQRSAKNHSGIRAGRKKREESALRPGGRPQGQALSILSAALSLGIPMAGTDLLLKAIPQEQPYTLVLRVPV